MEDSFGRKIDYLRISVTDKCNLRCRYCMPPEGVCLMPHDELLRLEELARLVRIMAGLGVRKVRLTGGEPLVRKNLVQLISEIKETDGIEEIAMTTNGVLLADRIKEYKAAGLSSVNISLDTLSPAVFEKITGQNALEQVLFSMQKALEAGLRVKLNCVPCRELNDAELEQLAGLARRYPLDVRFIELMPVGCGKNYHGIPSDEVLARLEKVYGKAVPTMKQRGNGPAAYYDFEGFFGKIGFISPLSHQFCSECNRVRLTAEGQLKLCLHYNTGVQLRELLRNGSSDAELAQAITDALQHKPKAHDFWHTVEDSDTRKMVQIGG